MEVLNEIVRYKVELDELRLRIEDAVKPEIPVDGFVTYEVPPELLEVRMNKLTFDVIKAQEGVIITNRNVLSTAEVPTIFGVKIRIDDSLKIGAAELWRFEG